MKSRVLLFLFLLIVGITAISCSYENEKKDISRNILTESRQEIETMPAETKNSTKQEAVEESKAEPEPVKGEYSGWLCGMVPNPEKEENSDVLVLNLQSGEVKKIITLEQISSTQTCAVSPDGNWVAYTDWLSQDPSEGVFLTVRNLISGEEKVYLQNNGCNPLLLYMMWLPDNHSLLLNLSLKNQQYYTDTMSILDIQTEEMRILDQGGVWQGEKTIDSDQDWTIHLTTQEELDKLIEKYGGKESIPVEENGSYNFVEFGSPSLSPNQKTVIYSVNFRRNSANWSDGEEMARLTLASGIFLADLEKGDARLIYANAVQKSCMGNVAWLDENTLVFDRYYNEMSNGDCDIVILDLHTGMEEIVSPRREGLTAQKVRGADGNSVWISTDGEEGEKFIQYDIKGQKKVEEEFSYGGEKISLWRFYEIP